MRRACLLAVVWAAWAVWITEPPTLRTARCKRASPLLFKTGAARPLPVSGRPLKLVINNAMLMASDQSLAPEMIDVHGMEAGSAVGAMLVLRPRRPSRASEILDQGAWDRPAAVGWQDIANQGDQRPRPPAICHRKRSS